MQHYLIALVALAALAIGSYTDIKKREVPDWLNYGIVAAGLGISAALSISFWNWMYIGYSIAGLALMFAIAYFMFYAGQWGGGDSKMLIGLGALLGLEFSLKTPFINFNSQLLALLSNIVLVGVAYALAWSIVIAARNSKKFSKELKSGIDKNRSARKILLAVLAALLIAILLVKDPVTRMLLALLMAASASAFYLRIFSKAVEKAGMLRKVPPDRLTEGDWIAKDVIVNGKPIAGPKDLGITKKQIALLISHYKKKQVGKILIKEGIPFIPSFLIAYLLTLKLGNALLLLPNLIQAY